MTEEHNGRIHTNTNRPHKLESAVEAILLFIKQTISDPMYSVRKGEIEAGNLCPLKKSKEKVGATAVSYNNRLK